MYTETNNSLPASNDASKPPFRSVFFISDGTAITAETLGRSILSQFPSVDFNIEVIPYIESAESAIRAAERIENAAQRDGSLPFVFDTIVNTDIRSIIHSAKACNFDIYEGLIGKMSDQLCIAPVTDIGHSHESVDSETYKSRIDAVHFALDNDDGARTHHYSNADVILVGVSRSGKTPTSIYLAMQFGIFAANYPLTEEDLDSNHLPKALRPYKDKLFGLQINADRLVAIRNERMADSRYSSYQQCQRELRAIQGIYVSQRIPNLDISEMSVEEIATRILQIKGLKRRIG